MLEIPPNLPVPTAKLSFVFNVFGNNCSPEIKSRIYILLKENNINDDLNVFVLNASSSIESSINNKKEEKK